MLLFWTIRYFDSGDKLFKNRHLWLDTTALDPAAEAALEMICALKDNRLEREVRKFRHLFLEMSRPLEEYQTLVERHGSTRTFCLPDYFEDEHGVELSRKQLAVGVTGNPDADFLPSGMTKNDVDYVLSEKRAIDLEQIALSPDQLKVLGYFARELREMMTSAFYKNPPGTLSRGGARGPRWVVETAASDEEIRSFVTIFRRLYMESEPAHFVKAVAVFAEALGDHPLARWVRGVADRYQKDLNEAPTNVAFLGSATMPFTQKRLFDVYLYTRYAHQPDERRARQFDECLAAVRGDRSVLTFLFLTELWKCTLHIRNAGTAIVDFYDRYCQAHNAAASVVTSLQTDHPGLGALEKQEDRQRRVFKEQTDELAKSLWRSAGQPECGHASFIESARKQLLTALRPAKR